MVNTGDGLAAALARGRKGGRPSKLSSDQIELAQRLYDAGEHTVAQMAGMLKVPRTTVYGHLNKRVDIAPVTQEISVVAIHLHRCRRLGRARPVDMNPPLAPR